MKKYIFLGTLFGIAVFGGIYWYFVLSVAPPQSIGDVFNQALEKPLEKYSFENLKKVEFVGGEIEIGKKVEEESDLYDSYIFYFPIENLDDPNKPLRGSGLMNIPVAAAGDVALDSEGEAQSYPVIVQFRGFVDPASFVPGEGSARSGQYFAENGFITLAPDYLGFGESDMPSEDPLEERFQTYTMALSLLASVPSINEALEGIEPDEENRAVAAWDGENIGVWGHSNGGHIALSALAISGKEYPAVLWNPVSKPFPYSILYYTDEYADNGLALRKVISDFEEKYDIELYSPPNYYKWIKAPIQIHQGMLDQEVLPWWSRELATSLGWEEEQTEGDIEYIEHADSDHNLMPGGWESAISSSANFFNSKFDQSE